MSYQEIKLSPSDVADKITKGAALACLRMTDEWQRAGTRSFNSNGAYYLWYAYKQYDICIMDKMSFRGKKRTQNIYKLTPFGQLVKAELIKSKTKSRSFLWFHSCE